MFYHVLRIWVNRFGGRGGESVGGGDGDGVGDSGALGG